MGQQEVLDFLKKNKGKWFTTANLNDRLNISIGSITNSCRKLRQCNFIRYKPYEQGTGWFYSAK